MNVSGRKIEWQLTNAGLDTVTIESIHLVWPEENGDLEKLKLDSKEIHDAPQVPPEATIEGGWNGQLKDRQIETDRTRTLTLEFAGDARPGNAVCDCCSGGDGDSDSDSDSGSDSGGDSDSEVGGDGDDARSGTQSAARGGGLVGAGGGHTFAGAWLDPRIRRVSAFLVRLGVAFQPGL